MKRSYLFNTEIAPLTEEEKEVIKQYNELARKRNKILQRTDKVIRDYIKKEKAKQNALQIKKNKVLEQKRIFEKQKEIEIQKVKQQEFPENYKNFEKKFNNMIDSINFYNKNDKIIELKNLQNDFSQYCIHPINFKDTGSYCDGDTAGGMGYSYSSCNACKLCKLGMENNLCTPVYINYTPAIENDLLDKLKHINN